MEFNGTIEDYDDGTSPSEVFSVTFFVPVCSLLISLTTSSLPNKITSALEVISINIVLLLALTSFCDNLVVFFLILSLPLITKLFYIYSQVTRPQIKFLKKCLFESQPLKSFNQKFIGDYRGHLLLATSICILAVDFAFFPVRFSKTQTYGWSIMDAGVGSFVLVHGLCSSSARMSNVNSNNFKKCLMSSIPLFMLGVIRLVVTTAVGYHKVVPEYGVHWNFFFTLAFTKVICYVISVCFSFLQPIVLAFVILLIHQTLLSTYLTDFILSETRQTFIEANKEGICALLGFVSIYFCGVQLGQFLWKERHRMIEFLQVLLILCGVGICGWILMYPVCFWIQPVSRRMTNLAYCIWVVSLTSLQISLHLAHRIINFVLSKIMQKEFEDSVLWKSINYNGLFYFLIANLLTGLVNMAIKTENCEDWLSFLIMTIYLAVLNLSVLLPYMKSIQMKFW